LYLWFFFKKNNIKGNVIKLNLSNYKFENITLKEDSHISILQYDNENFICTDSKYIYFIDIPNFKIVWDYKILKNPSKYTFSIITFNDFIYCSSFNLVSCFNKYGDLVWSTKVFDLDNFISLFVFNHFLFCAQNGVLACVNIFNGLLVNSNYLKGCGFGSICFLNQDFNSQSVLLNYF
jgi:hypothetical protein